MFWCTAITYIILNDAANKNKSKPLFFISLFLLALAGTLTHYYCIIFTVAICFVYCIMLLLKKSYKKTIWIILTGLACGACALGVFPAMYRHMFHSSRGKEASKNMTLPFSETINKYKSFIEIIDNEIFGGLMKYLLPLAICLIVFLLFKKRQHHSSIKQTFYSGKTDLYLLIFIPAAIYFLFVGKTAPYLVDRYMFPIFAIILTGFFSLISSLFANIRFKFSICLPLICIAAVIINGLSSCTWEYLYRRTIPILEKAKEFSDIDSLFINYNETINHENWRCHPSYMELKNYKSVTFLNFSDLDRLSSLNAAANDELIVFIPNTAAESLNKVLDFCPQFTNVEIIGTFFNNTSYFLSTRSAN